MWIVSNWVRIDSCCFGTHPVRAGCKYRNVISEDIPSNGIAFAAGKTCHDCFKITSYIYELTGFFHSGAVQAVSSTCFADNHYRWIFFIFMCEVPNDSACKRTNASLNKYVCWAVNSGFFELLVSFHYHSSISLHDP